ncbi:helix-turn-helix domain-containing protein [Nonomuraea sp. NPDC026600]|uniref:helix-turn-helix domain-containing protein n=1 Tax=Nonomuraea sp. NPDC026600 TaxID=3155363 RepID=UPI00340074F7
MELLHVGRRVRQARESAGLNQRELAQAVGLSQPTLARIELGTRSSLTIAELDRIATTLDIPLGDLTSGSPVRDRIRIAARITEDDANLREGAIQQAVSILILDDRLDRLVGKRPSRTARPVMSPPSFDPNTPAEEQGRAMANAVRLGLDLGGAPLADPAETAEWLTGADTAVLDFPSGIDGFTLTDPARDVTLIAVSAKNVSERQRFTFAHELGHLLFGDGGHCDTVDARRTPAEKRCDAFARHLLAPQSGIRAWLSPDDQPDERSCALLSHHFGASLMVILLQLERMGLLTRDQVEAMRGLTGARLARRYGWSRHYEREQEISRTRRPPRRILERATTAYGDGRLGVRILAGLEGRDPVETEAALADAGITPPHGPVRHADLNRLLRRAQAGREA